MNSFLEKLARSISWIVWLGRGIFFAMVILLIVMRSLITVIRIDGHSMDPTLRDGQWVAVDLISKRFHPWHSGDMAILRFPGDPIHSLYVKRVIGVPGDHLTIADGHLVKNGQVIPEPYLALGTTTEEGVAALPDVVPPDHYLVFGDNRAISNDSRYFGLVPIGDMVGKVLKN